MRLAVVAALVALSSYQVELVRADDTVSDTSVCPSADSIAGIESSNGKACCPLECGLCGGDDCTKAGKDADTDCCINDIVDEREACSETNMAPCRIDKEDGATGDDDNDAAAADDDNSWVQDGSLPTYEGAVEVGTMTNVTVTANGYDARNNTNGKGCGGVGGDGCAPANSRDGIASEIESRWSCAASVVDGWGPCQIVYEFDNPQDLVDIQIAFWKGNERNRTLEVYLNYEEDYPDTTFVSYADNETIFNTLNVSANGVFKVALASNEAANRGPRSNDDVWVSLIEVLFFVKP